MLSSTQPNLIPVEEYYLNGVCLSTDTKPTEKIANGSMLIEMDTATIYIYDKDNETWREFV